MSARDFQEAREPGYHGDRGSMHDNPTLDKATVARARVDVGYVPGGPRVRDFVNVGGLIYPDLSGAS
jgi:hypothetical protein